MDYYTVESVRNQITRNGQLEVLLVPDSFPSNWEYCPCAAHSRCNLNRKCLQRLGIYFTGPFKILSIIEIMFIKNRETGYIRSNQLSVIRLIEIGVIDQSQLIIIQF